MCGHVVFSLEDVAGFDQAPTSSQGYFSLQVEGKVEKRPGYEVDQAI